MKSAEKKKTGHGLVFDIIITILVFCSIGAGLFFALRPKKAATAVVEYRVVFDNVKNEVASKISVNKELLSEKGQSMGVVTSAIADRQVFYTIDRTSVSESEYIKNVSNEYKTVKAVITAQAVLENGSYYVGGHPIRAGEQIVLRQPDFYGIAEITAVSVKQE